MDRLAPQRRDEPDRAPAPVHRAGDRQARPGGVRGQFSLGHGPMAGRARELEQDLVLRSRRLYAHRATGSVPAIAAAERLSHGVFRADRIPQRGLGVPRAGYAELLRHEVQRDRAGPASRGGGRTLSGDPWQERQARPDASAGDDAQPHAVSHRPGREGEQVQDAGGRPGGGLLDRRHLARRRHRILQRGRGAGSPVLDEGVEQRRPARQDLRRAGRQPRDRHRAADGNGS